MGESYMAGWWDCDALDEFFSRVLRTDLPSRVRSFRDRVLSLSSLLLNRQSGSRGLKVGKQHYDAGNDLYRRMLDRRMIYSCAYWREADNLDTAQESKLDLVFRKLGLKPGMRVLDIGCGWGGAAGYAAEKYGVEVVGITISREQSRLARDRCQGLPVEIRLQGYQKTCLSWKTGRIFAATTTAPCRSGIGISTRPGANFPVMTRLFVACGTFT